jgi:hypothetical protein
MAATAAMRFHLDEHIDPDVATGLRRHGIDVTTAVDANLLAASDVDHLTNAAAERRVMVTGDSDFLRLHRHGVAHARIVFLPSRRSIAEIVDYLALMDECLLPDEIAGRVEYF